MQKFKFTVGHHPRLSLEACPPRRLDYGPPGIRRIRQTHIMDASVVPRLHPDRPLALLAGVTLISSGGMKISCLVQSVTRGGTGVLSYFQVDTLRRIVFLRALDLLAFLLRGMALLEGCQGLALRTPLTAVRNCPATMTRDT